MPNPVRFAVSLLLSALLVLPAQAASPEDFAKDKNAPATAAPTPAPKPATPAPAPVPAAKPAPAPKAAKTSAPMDTAKVHEQYLEGEFDQAIRSLEGQLKSKRAMTHAESVFVFKHLGVMYAAQQSTREKGKFYMSELIHIEPTAKILDMYASDMIHLIFRNVQEEFEVKRARLQPLPDTVAAAPQPVPADPVPAAPPPKTPSSGSARKRNIFLAATGATVAVGALALFFLLSGDEPGTKTIVVQE